MEEKEKPRLLVVAGSFTQALRYAAEKELTDGSWVFVRDVYDVRTEARKSEYVFVGSYVYNKMWEEIRKELLARNCVERKDV